MTATTIRTEYLEIGGVPLDTPAWEVTDLAPLWDIPEVRGEGVTIPYRRGELAFRRSFGGKHADLPIIITGHFDSAGNPAANPRAQLWLNRREYIRDVLRPHAIGTNTGDRTVRYYAPDGDVLSGPGKIVGGMRPQAVGPNAFRASLSLLLTEGGLRSETQVDVTSDPASEGNPEDLVVPNPGDDYQDATIINLTGTATSVRLVNLTADPGGEVFWEFGGSLDSGVDVDTATFAAVRDGISVIGLVTHGGFERWLPLVPGDNTIRVDPLGGTTTARLRHFPFYP